MLIINVPLHFPALNAVKLYMWCTENTNQPLVDSDEFWHHSHDHNTHNIFLAVIVEDLISISSNQQLSYRRRRRKHRRDLRGIRSV